MTKQEPPTLEDYKRKHDDFKTVIDGKRYVTQLRENGTTLVPIKEDRD